MKYEHCILLRSKAKLKFVDKLTQHMDRQTSPKQHVPNHLVRTTKTTQLATRYYTYAWTIQKHADSPTLTKYWAAKTHYPTMYML